MNKVILVGKIFNDVESKYTTTGQLYTKIVLKTSETYKDKNNETKWDNQFHRITLWGTRWEKFAKILQESKGRDLIVEGKLSYNSYEKDGRKEYTTEIIGDNCQLVK